MFWQDLLLDRTVEPEVLQSAAAQALSIDNGQVLVVPDIATVPDAAERTAILETSTIEAGDFPLKISVFRFDQPLDSDHIPFARKLCEILHARCAIPDASPDPYTMLLVDATGTLKVVSLDAAALDERGAYVLA